jgi:hypothetical protein
MELSSSWEAASCTAIHELPSTLWNPKVHYRVHKSPAPVPILSQINPVHTTPSHLSKINFNIINPRVLVFLEVSFLLAFSPISYMHSCLTHLYYMPCSSLLLDLIILIGKEYKLWSSSLFISPAFHHFISLQSKYSPQHPVLKHPLYLFLPSYQRPSFPPIQNHKQNYNFVYFNFYVLRQQTEERRFCSEW